MILESRYGFSKKKQLTFLKSKDRYGLKFIKNQNHSLSWHKVIFLSLSQVLEKLLGFWIDKCGHKNEISDKPTWPSPIWSIFWFTLIASKMGWRCENGDRGAKVINDKQNIQVMTFPIKKRINAELFIDRKWGRYIYKMISRKSSDLIKEGKWK